MTVSARKASKWGDEHGIEVDQYGRRQGRGDQRPRPASALARMPSPVSSISSLPSRRPKEKMIGDLTLDYQTNNKFFGGLRHAGRDKERPGMDGPDLSQNRRSITRIRSMAVYSAPLSTRRTAQRLPRPSTANGATPTWTFVLYDDLQEIPDGSRDQRDPPLHPQDQRKG